MKTAVAVLLWCAVLRAAEFYVAPSGDDGGPGSKARPWKTLERVNRQRLRPGDKVLLAPGATFRGPLTLTADDAGTAAKPVTIGSAGAGRAVIEAGAGPGVSVENAGGIVLENLVVTAAKGSRNAASGVRAVNTVPGDGKLRFLRITNVEASGFGRAGIYVGGLAVDGSRSGFENVLIENCASHDNVYHGILVSGPYDDDRSASVAGVQDGGQRPGYSNRNVTIRNCKAYRNLGDPAYRKNHSGNGILLTDTDGGLIEKSQAWENGALCTRAPGGPAGIWASGSNRVTIQYCESHHNHTGPDTPDGDGFDLDGGTTNSMMQYNYSHDNDGYGFLICNYSGAPHEHKANVVRYNLSENDGRKQKDGSAIHFSTDGPEIVDVDVYNNTVVLGPRADGRAVAAVTANGTLRGARLRNNLFVTKGLADLVRIEANAAAGLRFEGNAYWTSGAAVRIRWGGTVYDSLNFWSVATRQESVGGDIVGLFGKPAGMGVGQRPIGFPAQPRAPVIR